MFERVLIANRGEIAVRIIRTLRRMGIVSVAVYTDADRRAPHVELADLAVGIGEGRAYLDGPRLVEVACDVEADAVHPGYGFLSENAGFARACRAAGIEFIGPPAEAIELMGDKINAKRAVAASGVPVVPGRDEAGLSDSQLASAALEVGLPVLLKPSAGGGGKGMRRVSDAAELAASIEGARREAMAAFGDGTLLVERYVARPRHIEMQIFADRHGGCVALGERECSLQRRHQKIVEEAPSPLLSAATRASMADSAVAAARACDYVGAGTVEFIVSADRPGEYFFMEMNTRLQVEHPVTEAVLGLDLVELQVQVAAGERLPWSSQDEVPPPSGHSVEARVYAEDPRRGFLPSSGRVLSLVEPVGAEGVRVDSGLRSGLVVGTTYDPMLAKVVAWGPDRATSLRRLDHALRSTVVLGVTTNVGFLRRLLADPDVAAGELDTGLVERKVDGLVGGPPPDAVLVAAAVATESLERGGPGPWDLRDGWRVGGPAARISRWRLAAGSGSDGQSVEVRLVGDAAFVAERALGPVAVLGSDEASLTLELGGRQAVWRWARDGGDFWLGHAGEAWRLTREGLAVPRRAAAAHGGGRVTSPMPGTVLGVHVTPGQDVQPGDRLVVVEAMKMEHTVRAGTGGMVEEVLVGPGDSVRLDQPLVVIKGTEAEEPESAE